MCVFMCLVYVYRTLYYLYSFCCVQVVVWVDPLDGTMEFTKGELKTPCKVYDCIMCVACVWKHL